MRTAGHGSGSCKTIGSAALLWLALSAPAAAHDLALQLRRGADGIVEGRLSYSDDRPAAGSYLQVRAPDDPSLATLALQTDEDGRFRVPLAPRRRYAITAEGEEGHRVTVEIGGAAADPSAAGGRWPPVYLVLGALLLLSLPLARRLRL